MSKKIKKNCFFLVSDELSHLLENILLISEVNASGKGILECFERCSVKKTYCSVRAISQIATALQLEQHKGSAVLRPALTPIEVEEIKRTIDKHDIVFVIDPMTRHDTIGRVRKFAFGGYATETKKEAGRKSRASQ